MSAAHPTDATAIADAIKAADTVDADILLIAGASAIVDRADALPAGIEQAGGTVLHFGMPVDPGNLIMLAERNGKPVIGLPGCARSPKLNGFDWALAAIRSGCARDAAGYTGHGRWRAFGRNWRAPLPRAEATRTPADTQHAPKVAAMVLAAGQSRRMGQANKLLEVVDGRAMVVTAVEAALAADVSSVTVVTGHEADSVQAALAGKPVRFVHNPDYADGLSASLKTAAANAPDNADAMIVLLGDMPDVTSAHVDRLIAAFNPLEGRAICVPTVGGKRGNPSALGQALLGRNAGTAGRCRCQTLDRPERRCCGRGRDGRRWRSERC